MAEVVEIVTASIVITGSVQGVGFRYFASDLAEQLGITGWVKNLSDGRVEVEAHGVQEIVEVMIEKLHQGPSHASVIAVDVTWVPEQARPDHPRYFQIVR